MDRLHLSLESSGVNVLGLLYLLRSNKPADKYLEMVVVQYCSRLQTRGIFFGILAFVGPRFLEYRTTCIHVKANLSFNIRAMYTTICQLQGVGGREASPSPRRGLPIDQSWPLGLPVSVAFAAIRIHCIAKAWKSIYPLLSVWPVLPVGLHVSLGSLIEGLN